jgi:hypothetical protein
LFYYGTNINQLIRWWGISKQNRKYNAQYEDDNWLAKKLKNHFITHVRVHLNKRQKSSVGF